MLCLNSILKYFLSRFLSLSHTHSVKFKKLQKYFIFFLLSKNKLIKLQIIMNKNPSSNRIPSHVNLDRNRYPITHYTPLTPTFPKINNRQIPPIQNFHQRRYGNNPKLKNPFLTCPKPTIGSRKAFDYYHQCPDRL